MFLYTLQILFPLLKCWGGGGYLPLLRSLLIFEMICMFDIQPNDSQREKMKVPAPPIRQYLRLNELLASSLLPELHVCYYCLMVICPKLQHAKKPCL